MFKTEQDYEVERRRLMVQNEMMKCILMVLVGFPVGVLLLIILLIFTS